MLMTLTLSVAEAKQEGIMGGESLLPSPNEFFKQPPEEEMGRGGPARSPAALITLHPFSQLRWMVLLQACVQV